MPIDLKTQFDSLIATLLPTAIAGAIKGVEGHYATQMLVKSEYPRHLKNLKRASEFLFGLKSEEQCLFTELLPATPAMFQGEEFEVEMKVTIKIGDDHGILTFSVEDSCVEFHFGSITAWEWEVTLEWNDEWEKGWVFDTVRPITENPKHPMYEPMMKGLDKAFERQKKAS